MSVCKMGISKHYLDSIYEIDARKQTFIMFDVESNRSRWISFLDIFIQLSRVFFLAFTALFCLSSLILTALSCLILGCLLAFIGVIFSMSAKYRFFLIGRASVFLKQGARELFFTLPCSVFSRVFFICFHMSLVLGDLVGVFFPEIGRIFRSVNQVVVSVGLAFKQA